VILLDTNVLSELMRAHPSPNVIRWLDAQADADLYISVISKTEIQLGISRLPNGKRKIGLSAAADELLAEFRERCVELPCSATPFYVRVAEASRSLGRPMSIEDMQIAAIAMYHSAVLATRNVRDFSFLPDLKLQNPWDEADGLPARPE
jgi:predicted nucleic acid-binding protein